MNTQGYAVLSQKHMASRFSVGAALTENVARMSRVGRTRQLNWLQEVKNQAPTSSPTGCSTASTLACACPSKCRVIQWGVLPGLVNYGTKMYDEGEQARKRRCGSTDAPGASAGKRTRQGASGPW